MKNNLWIIIAAVVAILSTGSEVIAISPDAVVSTMAGQRATSGATDGIGTAASFSFSAGLATDGANLYIADTFNHTIRKIVISTAEVTTLAGTAGVSGSADGVGAAALFNAPRGITTDGTNLYVADTSNCTIRKIVISTGEVTTLAGTAGFTGSTDGVGADATFEYPSGVTTDGCSLYIADTGNGTIRKIQIDTREVTTVAGSAGVFGSLDAIGLSALFNNSIGITTDGINLYIVDNGNSTIRQIVIATGAVTTLAGTAGIVGSSDGIGGAALFNNPQGITTDGSNLYVTDTANGTIRKILISSGEVSTLAGTVGIGGTVDGTPANARFSIPSGIITVGSETILHIADMGTMRKIQ